VFEENSVREITDYYDAIVLEWLRFQIAFCEHEKAKVGVLKFLLFEGHFRKAPF